MEKKIFSILNFMILIDINYVRLKLFALILTFCLMALPAILSAIIPEYIYSQTCIKRSLLGQRKGGLLRQVTSYKRFNSCKIFLQDKKKVTF